MAWRSDSQMVAFELQQSPVPLSEIEARAESYARAGIAQIWIPFLRSNYMEKAKLELGGLLIERYPARPFERWVHGLHGDNGMWMYDPKSKSVWLSFMKPTQLYVQESSWYGEGGEEMTSGGRYYDSKRYCDLNLFGPFQLSKLMIRLTKRESFRSPIYNWPRAKIASFVRITAE
jgi:competence protein CoiA